VFLLLLCGTPSACRSYLFPARFTGFLFDKGNNTDKILPISPVYGPEHPMTTICKHPRVRIVAREEDAEYVECLDCGEVFDSAEFQDMAIEEEVAEEEE
jgi:hypothetical protein